MAARKVSGELPEGSVVISEEEAISLHWRLLMNWTPASDTWIFRHGMAGVAATSALTSIYINNVYRTKLHLGNFGRFSSYLPIVFIPALCNTIYHQQHVTNDILIQKTVCPICVEMRAAGIHSFFSVALPTILAPVQGFAVALRHYTYSIPSMFREPKEVLKLWVKLTRPIGSTLLTLALAQACFAMGLTYYEEKAFTKIQRTLHLREQYDTNAGNLKV